MENFVDELSSIFTLMCREKNCPVITIQCRSNLLAKEMSLHCPFQREQDCQEVTDDDWLEVFSKNYSD